MTMSTSRSITPVRAAPIVVVGANRRCLLPAAAAALGYTVKAIERKIERGEWVEGVHWGKAPDGRRYINLDKVTAWMGGELGQEAA